MLTTDANDQSIYLKVALCVAEISARFSKFPFALFCYFFNKLLDDWTLEEQ